MGKPNYSNVNECLAKVVEESSKERARGDFESIADTLQTHASCLSLGRIVESAVDR